ncbi:MAG: aldolase/citrate lyase family protein [Candidatus Poribacteria bacterium]
MAEPSLKETLRDGGTIKTTRIPMASTHEEVQEFIRRDACEMIYIDSQHGPHTEWDVARICTAAEELGVGVQLRIKHTRYAHLIQGYLDIGVFCIKVPQVEEESIVEEAVNSFYFPPFGKRSWCGFMGYGIEGRRERREYADWWNNHGILGFKIESIKAVVSIRNLVKPGIDYVDFGGSDLAFDLETNPHPLLKTLEDCREHVKRELADIPVKVL